MLHEKCPYLQMGGHQGEWVEDSLGVVCTLCSERQAEKPKPAPRKINAKEKP